MAAQALYEAAGAFCGSAAIRSTRTWAEAANRPPERPAVIHSSLYLRAPVYEALRKIAFDERAKIHDLVMQGIEAVLRKRGYPSVDDLKSGKK
jgi:hypothetical protein